MFFIFAFCLFLQDRDAELYDLLCENSESIGQYASTLDEPATDREVIEGWLASQPATFSGSWRERRKERRERTPEEQQELNDFKPDKKTIWNRREVIRKGKAEGAKKGRVIFWSCCGAAVIICTTIATWKIVGIFEGDS